MEGTNEDTTVVNVPDVVVHGQYSLPTAETMGGATTLGISAKKNQMDTTRLRL